MTEIPFLKVDEKLVLNWWNITHVERAASVKDDDDERYLVSFTDGNYIELEGKTGRRVFNWLMSQAAESDPPGETGASVVDDDAERLSKRFSDSLG